MTRQFNRRHFLGSAFAFGAGAAAWPLSRALVAPTKTTQTEPEGFFTLGRQKDHWWLIKPDGKPFFSLGLNHIDPATMRYPENIHLWREKYNGSTLKWIRESVSPNLKIWGFNSGGYHTPAPLLKRIPHTNAIDGIINIAHWMPRGRFAYEDVFDRKCLLGSV